MTDTERGMDPRYDPRFQRGYDASRDGEATAPAGAPTAVGARGDAERGAAGRDAAGPDAGGEPEPPSSLDAARDRPAYITAPPPEHPADPDPSTHSDPDPAADPRRAQGPMAGPRRPGERDPESDRRAAVARVHSWLIAGWAVTGGALLLGTWLAWSVNSDFSYYGGVVDQASENLRVLGWALAPSLLLTGAIGAVVVTGVAANLHDDARPAGSEEGPRFRRAPAWWALLAIVVAAVVLIAWAVALAAEGNRVGSSLQFSPDGNVSDDQQALLDTMALGQVAQMLIPALASAAIAALVAVAVIEVWRAARGMPRRIEPDGR
ncbi:hypothetical protein ACFVAJ_06105 [Agromyces sp. NPDC057679]|uniref:hypothetical protein n=1 Tax=Agromyces sp. NPDC057679 TaxID=3346207 RepID=UPI003672B761